MLSALAILATLIFLAVAPSQAQSVGTDQSQEASGGTAKPLNLLVTKVDDESVKPLLVAKGKPLLVNFWATWCEPCRQEFPDLVELDKDYEGKIDFITISLDDPVEIDRDVPRFLAEMKSTMATYLLRTDDESGVIGAISDTWQGGLPFTVLYDGEGTVQYARQGKIKVPVVRAMLDQLIASHESVAVTELVKVLGGNRTEAVFYFRNNWFALREEAVKRGFIESFEMQVADRSLNPGDGGGPDIVLITRYKNDLQFRQSEYNFQKLIKEMRPEGPMLASTLKPPEFRQSISVSITRFAASN